MIPTHPGPAVPTVMVVAQDRWTEVVGEEESDDGTNSEEPKMTTTTSKEETENDRSTNSLVFREIRNVHFSDDFHEYDIIQP